MTEKPQTLGNPAAYEETPIPEILQTVAAMHQEEQRQAAEAQGSGE